jgi:prohead serine protease
VKSHISIGFRTTRARVDPVTRVRKLSDVKLWEISVVTFPLLAGARVRAVKQGGMSLPARGAFPPPSPSRMFPTWAHSLSGRSLGKPGIGWAEG